MKRIIYIVCFLAACSDGEDKIDAYGNFEATQINVAATHPGKLLEFKIEEGGKVSKGEIVGIIDTINLHLQKKQLLAKKDVLRAKTPNIANETEVLTEQKQNVKRELERFTKLAKDGAVPQKQVDDLQDQLNVLNKRIKVVQSQNQPVHQELKLIDVQIEQIEQQINDAFIKAPASGTILLKLAEEGEIVSPAIPLFHMADLSHLILRAYISGSQLDNISIGQEVKVYTDKNKEDYHQYSGMITWISDEAEFTPKVIQTKDERTDLVYAIKIKVPNDGSLKIGMPAEVNFSLKDEKEND